MSSSGWAEASETQGEPARCKRCGEPVPAAASGLADEPPCPACGNRVEFDWIDEPGPRVVVVPLRADLAPEVVDRIAALFLSGPSDGVLVLDLRHVRSLRSVALARLIVFWRTLVARGGRITLRRLDAQLRPIFQVAGPRRIFLEED